MTRVYWTDLKKVGAFYIELKSSKLALQLSLGFKCSLGICGKNHLSKLSPYMSSLSKHFSCISSMGYLSRSEMKSILAFAASRASMQNWSLRIAACFTFSFSCCSRRDLKTYTAMKVHTSGFKWSNRGKRRRLTLYVV